MVHNEKICHDTGGRRLHYLNQIKCILNKIDTLPCPDEVQRVDPNLKPLSEYPEYKAKEGNKTEPFVPLITNVQIKEVRRTSHLADHIHENCRNLEYVPVDFLENQHAPMDQKGRLKSFELKGGYLIPGCICTKRDGLQDKCELQGCQRKDLCMADPSPLCAPANVMYGGNLPEEVRRHIPEPPTKKCCCDKQWTREQMPQNFECYPCYDGKGPGH
ncbi:hypothetical protein GE061_015851 [Apolygus lucorum]|uniref:Uncharacterized protein n=1 Tax=Apolygus lucorum TaxID=248454 RepID=A0A6A4JKA0_APOLU|nr:hypothetical protein GE061_015851 [Apolygus lucorum]